MQALPAVAPVRTLDRAVVWSLGGGYRRQRRRSGEDALSGVVRAGDGCAAVDDADAGAYFSPLHYMMTT